MFKTGVKVTNRIREMTTHLFKTANEFLKAILYDTLIIRKPKRPLDLILYSPSSSMM